MNYTRTVIPGRKLIFLNIEHLRNTSYTKPFVGGDAG